jgi:hypothetical protein
MSQSSPRPASDPLAELVALVERKTAALGNREAWPAILDIAKAEGVTGEGLGEFRKAVWGARGAGRDAKRLARAAKKDAAREKSWAKLLRRVELSRERKGRPDKLLRAIHSLRRDIVVDVER